MCEGVVLVLVLVLVLVRIKFVGVNLHLAILGVVEGSGQALSLPWSAVASTREHGMAWRIHETAENTAQAQGLRDSGSGGSK